MLEFGDVRLGRRKAQIGALADAEKDSLRRFAGQVRELSANMKYAEKRRLWKKHNSLQGERPMVLAFPEDGWREIIPYESMTLADPFWREYEWYLKYLIYRGQTLHDDNVLDPVIEVPMIYWLTGWGLDPSWLSSGHSMGAMQLEPVLKRPDDAKLLKPLDMIIDEAATQEIADAVGEVLGDLLEIKINRSVDRFDRYINKSLVEELMLLRGIDQVYLDMYDRPEWLHGILRFMSDSELKLMDRIENTYRMEPNNGNHHVGSGGLGYTGELPLHEGAGAKVGFEDLWGFSDSQELSSVSPAMFDEFAIAYQVPLLSRYGLSCYACCESLNDKFPIVKKIPNLRRISISPWTDVGIAAEALGDRYIFSWKPHPAFLTTQQFNPDALEKNIKNTLDVARGCNVEMVFKDTQTFMQQPERIEHAVDVAMKLACGG
jgi:hypothetical protein